ncbi:hypothetical protein IH824_08690 [candidate division KSB1 bacterium]|nr:hypothetical protein [candidate division KSB1 bacterium]
MATLSKLALDELINNEMVKAVPRTIAFGDGQRFASMKVVSLGENVRQLMIGSVETQGYGIGKPQPFDELLDRSNNIIDIRNTKKIVNKNHNIPNLILIRITYYLRNYISVPGT